VVPVERVEGRAGADGGGPCAPGKVAGVTLAAFESDEFLAELHGSQACPLCAS
jgi:hypothetical protein